MLFAITAAFVSCKKDTNLDKQKIDHNALKLQKIKKFMSVIWGVSLENIVYDTNTKEFSADQIRISKAELEKIYDASNEYKLTYENQIIK